MFPVADLGRASLPPPGPEAAPPIVATSTPASPAVPSPAGLATSEARSAEELLGELEAKRAVVFFRLAAVLCLLVMAALPILPGALWLRALTGSACLAASILCASLSYVAADPGRYTPRVATTSSVLLTLLSMVIIYYLGLYSASATFLTVGIYFYGMSQSRVVARSAYATCAIAYFLGTAAIALGALPDLAVFSVAGVPAASRLYRVIMQQAIFAMVFYLARESRRATQITLEKVRQNDLELRQKEAQLLEAKTELDRALGPGEGRHSGQQIEGYELGDQIGRGGMGEVYAATHVASGAAVAIKLLHPAMLEDPTNVERFMREARATSAVPHEHVAQVLGVGQTNSGAPYIVMELLEGHDLAWHLRRHPQLDLAVVVEMVEHTARALSTVREAGIVHRDLKPGNLFLTDSIPRRWKVLDFGLSKLQGASTLTKDQAVGTPSYMSPEQINGKSVDHLADLYALAAIAYRALTGRPPFVGEQVAKVLMDVLTRMPEAPGAFAPLPVEVELVLALGLAKKKTHRFANVEDFARALRRAARGALDDETRGRGWTLIKQQPWGSSQPIP